MPNSIVLIPNELSIERVARSPFWRMRWKENSRWRSKTTKRSVEAEADQYARQEYATKQVLKEHGIDKDVLHSVKDISKIYYEGLSNKIKNGSGKASYDYYMSIVRNYIDPIAGNWSIKEVSNSRIQEYEDQIASKLRRVPSKGTLNQHNIVWRNIFKVARDKKWCSSDDVPEFTIKDKGQKINKRPSFDLKEYVHFRRFLRDYHKSAIRYSSEYKRQVLREYCIMCFATGMRPGEEPLNLKWKHFIEHKNNIEVHVPEGKTGTRSVVPMNMIKRSVRRLRKLSNHTDPEDYVFCMPNGKQLKDMSSMVGRAITDAGLRLNALGKTRTAYSMRHTYASFNIMYRNFSYEELADNMGTSPLMIHLHYNDVKPQDKARRLSTGKLANTGIDRKLDRIQQMLEGNFTDEIRDYLMQKVDLSDYKEEEVFVKAFEIEVDKWNEKASNDSETATGSNLKYVFQAAQNRYFEFIGADSIW